MFGITLKSLEINVETREGKFSTFLPFHRGLNIIRAENTSGKSTCVNAIAYALGLEAILGPRGKRPFPKSLYEIIEDSKKDPIEYYVVGSKVTLSVENNQGRSALLIRNIKEPGIDKITVCEVDSKTDYFLGSSGSAGSAQSERGFHYWLERFLGWHLPNVAKFDGGESKLYLECIFPLFFIEQKRGWSEIQANIPTTWGLKNVKRNAIEFCLGIDGFELEKKINSLKTEISTALNDWENLRAKAKDIADFSSLRVNSISEINDKDGNFSIQFLFPENNNFNNAYSRKMALRKYIEQLSNTPAYEVLNDKTLQDCSATIRSTRREIEETNKNIELVIISSKETEQKIETLTRDYDQYQQLRRLRQVGSNVSLDLNTSVCPICDTELLDTLGNNTAKRTPMSLDENIHFLKNQLDFYNSIKRRNLDKIQFLNETAQLLNGKLKYEDRILRQIKADLREFDGEEKNKLRKKIETEAELEIVLKIEEHQKHLNEKSKQIREAWKYATEALKSLRSKAKTGSQHRVTSELKALLRSNLKAFGFNPSAINQVDLSERTLRPEQEGYDIVAESSASDYIRIIWSYTLALLQLAGMDSNAKHGGFIVFDEPRQQEANMVSFANLVNTSAQSSKYNGQVIFATSLAKEEIEDACKNKDVNLICFDKGDYVLSLDDESKLNAHLDM